jgi:molybdopterin-guanine dinucleotide biosynthesis protein B
VTPILAISGSSGSGKTRLLVRLLAALRRRGLIVAALKHSGHGHSFDRRGKDSDRLRRAGAVAVAISSPAGVAYFGPPVTGARALARLLPPADLILAEGFKSEPLPRIEVHRRANGEPFLCARDRRVIAVVTDEPPPRPLPTFDANAVSLASEVERLAELVQRRFAPRRSAKRRRAGPREPGVLAATRPRAHRSSGQDVQGPEEIHTMTKTTKKSTARSGRITRKARAHAAPSRATGRKSGRRALGMNGAEVQTARLAKPGKTGKAGAAALGRGAKAMVAEKGAQA